MRRHRILFVVGFLACAASAAAQTNPSFETGNFTGWTSSGFIINEPTGIVAGGPNYATYVAAEAVGTAKAPTDAVVAQQTTSFDGLGTASPAINPTAGNFLAFVTNQTSAGNATITGTAIRQTFTIPAGATTLELDVRLLNNDTPTDFAEFDDFGGVALTQGSTIVGHYNADLDPASSADVHVTAGAAAGGFRNSTGWQHVTLDVSAVNGQTVTMNIYSLNYGGDNSVETRLLVDNITAVVATPTLSQWVLMLLAAALAIGGVLLQKGS